MESPEDNPHVSGQLHVRLQITPKGAQIYTLFKKRVCSINNSLFSKWCWENWTVTCKSMKWDDSLKPYIKTNLGRKVGGGFRIRNSCTPMEDSCQCMAKPIQYCKVKKKK